MGSQMNVRPYYDEWVQRNLLRHCGAEWTSGECDGGVSEKVYCQPRPIRCPPRPSGGLVVCTGRARIYFARLQKVSAKRTTDNIVREAND